MIENVGGWDRNLRLACGAAAVLAALTIPMPKGWKIGLFALAATEFTTAATRYCPINQALGVNTKYQDIQEAAHEAVETVRAIA